MPERELNSKLSSATLITTGESNMITETLLTEDKLVDMLFITTLTGLTDKWFYKN